MQVSAATCGDGAVGPCRDWPLAAIPLAAAIAVIATVSTDAPAVTDILPLNEPDVLGENATLMVQLDPAARFALQVVPVAENGPVRVGVARLALVPPKFVSVMVSAEDCEPGGVVSKVRVAGEATTLAGTAGGVVAPPSCSARTAVRWGDNESYEGLTEQKRICRGV